MKSAIKIILAVGAFAVMGTTIAEANCRWVNCKSRYDGSLYGCQTVCTPTASALPKATINAGALGKNPSKLIGHDGATLRNNRLIGHDGATMRPR